MLRQALAAPSRILRSSARAAGQRWPAPAAQLRPVPLPVICRPTRTVSSVRWSSSEAGKSDPEPPAKEGEAAPAKEAEAAPAKEESTPNKELEAKTKEVEEWKTKYRRAVDDFLQFQDRKERDMKAAREFAIQKFARDLIETVDNLERALSTVPADKLEAAAEVDKDLTTLHEGIEMTKKILIQTLDKHGVERFDPMGAKFNPNEHEATLMNPMPDKEDNSVFFTQQTGFKLNGRVLRPAKVGVVKNS